MITALIVDDHPAICFAVKAVLSQKGNVNITSVADGIAAMSSIKTQRPDLVILDIALAKMDGLEILARIQQYDKSIKVIVLTGQPEEIYAERALRAGAVGFFSKNSDISQLASLSDFIMAGYSCFPTGCIERLQTQIQMADADDLEGLAKLSDRELTVLRYLAKGMSNKEIADRLLLSNKTISTYKTRLMDKLQLDNLEQLNELLQAGAKEKE